MLHRIILGISKVLDEVSDCSVLFLFVAFFSFKNTLFFQWF